MRNNAETARQARELACAASAVATRGCEVVGQVVGTMQETSEAGGKVHRVSELIGEITLATQEQTRGIGQVNDAVAQLDEVTQQNAALVEESAAAAESLKEQAHRLVAAVAVFKTA